MMKILKSGRDQVLEKKWKAYMLLLCFAIILLMPLFVVGIYGALEPSVNGSSQEQVLSKGRRNFTASATNLVTSTTGDYDSGEGDQDGNDNNDDGDGSNDDGDGSANRVGGMVGSSCSKDNILVFQGPTSPMPNGIPTYSVEIQNVCLSGSCSISGIHLSCGWFSSARLINPRVFRRIGYDDCLVNDGEALNPGEALSFQYANTFQYPLSVSSVSC